MKNLAFTISIFLCSQGYAQSNTATVEKPATINNSEYKNSTNIELNAMSSSGTANGVNDFSYGDSSQSSRNIPEGDIKINQYQLKMAGMLSETSQISGGTSFVERNFSSAYGSYKVTGLSNLDLALKRFSAFDSFELNYGLGTSLSLAPTKIVDSKFNNNFSGYNRYDLFLGSEFTVGKVDVGVGTAYQFYQSRFKEEDYKKVFGADGELLTENRHGIAFNFHGEVPLYRQLKIGLAAGTSTTAANVRDFDIVKIAKSDVNASNYSSGIYGVYSYDNQTNVKLGISSRSQKTYFGSEESALTVGLNRSL